MFKKAKTVKEGCDCSVPQGGIMIIPGIDDEALVRSRFLTTEEVEAMRRKIKGNKISNNPLFQRLREYAKL